MLPCANIYEIKHAAHTLVFFIQTSNMYTNDYIDNNRYLYVQEEIFIYLNSAVRFV